MVSVCVSYPMMMILYMMRVDHPLSVAAKLQAQNKRTFGESHPKLYPSEKPTNYKNI